MPAIAKKTTRSTAKTVAAKKAPAKKAPAKSTKAKKPALAAPATKTAAQLRKIEAAKAAKRAEIQSGFKPVRTVFNRSELMERLAAETGLTKRECSSVYDALIGTAMGALMPRAVGEFTFPGFQKLMTKKIPAKKGGQKVVSFGVERISKPKPATVRVKARLLSRVRQVAIPA